MTSIDNRATCSPDAGLSPGPAMKASSDIDV